MVQALGGARRSFAPTLQVRLKCAVASSNVRDFRDVWAEDSTDPQLSIDLTECENVYPSASARNYGIEIKVA